MYYASRPCLLRYPEESKQGNKGTKDAAEASERALRSLILDKLKRIALFMRPVRES